MTVVTVGLAVAVWDRPRRLAGVDPQQANLRRRRPTWTGDAICDVGGRWIEVPV